MGRPPAPSLRAAALATRACPLPPPPLLVPAPTRLHPPQSNWGYNLGSNDWQGPTGYIAGKSVDPLMGRRWEEIQVGGWVGGGLGAWGLGGGGVRGLGGAWAGRLGAGVGRRAMAAWLRLRACWPAWRDLGPGSTAP